MLYRWSVVEVLEDTRTELTRDNFPNVRGVVGVSSNENVAAEGEVVDVASKRVVGEVQRPLLAVLDVAANHRDVTAVLLELREVRVGGEVDDGDEL